MIHSLLRTAIIALLLAVLPDASFAQMRLRASYGSLAVSQVVLPLGVRAGIFQKNGLNIEPIYIGGRSVSALISGDVQFGFMGGPPAILAQLGGANLVMIAGLNGLDQILVSIPSIKRGADLIGKKVGISRFGTTADYGARINLKKLKLLAQKDVTLIQIGDTPARIGGMLSGAIEAASLSSSERELATQNGFYVLVDNSNVEFPGNAVVTTRAYLKTNREDVKRFLRGLVEVIQFAKTQPERTKKMLAEIYRQNDQSVIEKRYQAMVEMFPAYPYLTKGAVQSFLEILREEGKVKEPVDPESFLAMSLLREVEAEHKRQ
ncbi:MAG TPA: ABC transporter substrate-binding protein [Candidatus Acidoferrales bacterium]|nr:ABC transporter substrate-binding protein [Candidatus Acidoferrales bacterium]